MFPGLAVIPVDGMRTEKGLLQEQDVAAQRFRAALSEQCQISGWLIGHCEGSPGEECVPGSRGLAGGIGSLDRGDGGPKGIALIAGGWGRRWGRGRAW